MIPFFDFRREYSLLKYEITEKTNKVLSSGVFIEGREVKNFENQFSKYVGSKFGLGVNSGSDALFMAVNSLNIGDGHEVITVSHTFISSIDGISRNGAVPVFVDIDPESYCIDTTKVESKITNKTRAILVVHIYGHPVDMNPILEIAEKHDLRVIEDCSQAHGAKYKGDMVGSLGDVSCFSFYPVKNLGAYGDGGFIATNDDYLFEKLAKLHNYGQSEKNHHDFIGLNSRLDEIQAAILNVKLKYLDSWNDKRRRLANIYYELLNDSLYMLPSVKDYVEHVYHLYVIRTGKRDEIQNYLAKNGFQSMIHYPIPVHKQKAYSYIGNRYELPITDKICEEILSLPMNPWLKEYEVEKICEILNRRI